MERDSEGVVMSSIVDGLNISGEIHRRIRVPWSASRKADGVRARSPCIGAHQKITVGRVSHQIDVPVVDGKGFQKNSGGDMDGRRKFD